MQNGAQKNPVTGGKLLGFVRVLIGGQEYQLSVQAVPLEKDGERAAGGFFAKDGQLGILVDDSGTPDFVQAQIEQGTEEAVRHLSRKYLN